MAFSSEMGEPSKTFMSTLIPLSETIRWKVHNISSLLKHSCFSAMTIPLEVGVGPIGLSKWEISLASSSSMLQAKAKLVGLTTSSLNVNQCVPHNVTFWIQRNGLTLSQVQYEKDFLRCKEAYLNSETNSTNSSTTWEIIPLEDLHDVDCGIVNLEEDCIEIILKLTVFGQDLSQQ